MKSTLRRLPVLVLLLAFASVQSMPALGKVAKSVAGAALAGKPQPANAVALFNPYPPMVYPVRIGILTHVSSAKFATWAPGAIFVDARPLFPLKPNTVYRITGREITDTSTGQKFSLPADKRTHVSSPDYRVYCDKWWRGCLEIVTFGSNVNVINLLDIEDYLLGVVPAEMPPSWHAEALKAQAIAARSYAWAHIGKGSKWYNTQGYDLVPDVRDQAYKGLAREAPSTFSAVAQTRGIVLKDSGRVKPGFYRATVGDCAETNLNMRSAMVPKSTLEKITGVADIQGIAVKQWDINGNARSVQVMGAKKRLKKRRRTRRRNRRRNRKNSKIGVNLSRTRADPLVAQDGFWQRSDRLNACQLEESNSRRRAGGEQPKSSKYAFIARRI